MPDDWRVRKWSHEFHNKKRSEAVEELRKTYDTPQVYQFYFHKDRGLNRAMMERAKTAGVNVMMLTVGAADLRRPPGVVH